MNPHKENCHIWSWGSDRAFLIESCFKNLSERADQSTSFEHKLVLKTIACNSLDRVIIIIKTICPNQMGSVTQIFSLHSTWFKAIFSIKLLSLSSLTKFSFGIVVWTHDAFITSLSYVLKMFQDGAPFAAALSCSLWNRFWGCQILVGDATKCRALPASMECR